MSVQGLLDLVLEISVDLSSTSTSISISTPAQTPSRIPGSKVCVSSNAAPEGSRIAVSVKGHASLSKLATAKLTGMSSQLHLKNESGMNAFDSLSIPMGDGVCSSLTIRESALLIKTTLKSFKYRDGTTSCSGGNKDVHDGSDADFNKSVSLLHTSILFDTTTVLPPHPADLHPPTDQRTHSTNPPLDDTRPNRSPLHLPLSVRLGAVGHACHQAAVTALSILSSPSSSQCPSSSTSLSREHLMSSNCDANIIALEDLLLLVFDAYGTVGSIGVEDSMLEEAADAAELLLRGREDARREISSDRAAEDKGAELGRKSCRQIPDSQRSLYRLTDSTPGASHSTADRLNGTRSKRGLSSFSASSSFASHDGDRIGSYSDSVGVSGSNGVGVGVPLTSGEMGWSDDSSSSDASENDTSYLDDVTTKINTRTLAPSKSRVRPSDLFALAVRNLPEGVRGSIERFDLHCQAFDVYVTEFDGATTGAYEHFWPLDAW